MPLDKVVIKHLDDMDLIEDAIQDEVDKIISRISIDGLIEDPEVELMKVAEQVQDYLEEDVYEDAAVNGFEFAKTVEKDKEIEIPDSNDPNLNEDLVDLNLAQGEQT